jgi:two-component system sensor histidine kinase YesM
VENSIIHGIDDDERTVNINISARSMEDLLLIKIADDGKGFSPESVDNRTSKNKLSGIGIDNVNERIRLNFGEGFGLTTNSRRGEGTVTDIILPLSIWEEEDIVQCIDRR